LDVEAAALLDAQSGERPGMPITTARRGVKDGAMFNPGADDASMSPGYGDSGGASRFFAVFQSASGPGVMQAAGSEQRGPGCAGYGALSENASRFLYTPKPDRSERDIGCEDLRPATGGEATARQDGSAGLQNPRAGAGRNGGARNIHPTVKPVDLMRWLCRLITPRGGLVLDPFMGSGTTGVACAREGFRFIGIEREPAYMEIAKRRIHGDAPLLNRPEVA
jgi:site-specific DNA-methyltransferase (adenine-specific)